MLPAHTNPFGELPERQIAPEEEIVKAELAGAVSHDPGERLSILYLMVWTAGSAVILAFERQTFLQVNSPTNPAWLQAISALLVSPMQGAGLAAVGLAAWRKFQGGRQFPKEPGHWLLIIAGVNALSSWSLYLATLPVQRMGFGVYLTVYRLPLLVVFCTLATYAVSRMHVEARWRGMFLIWIGANIFGYLVTCAMYFGSLSNGHWWSSFVEVFIIGGVNLAFLIPAILDLTKGPRRDSLHWAGLACRIANLGLAVVTIARMFLPVS